MDQLSTGLLARVTDNNSHGPICVKVTELEQHGTKYKCKVTDGSHGMACVLATQVSTLVSSGAISNNTIIRAKDYCCNNINGADVLIVTEADVVDQGKAPQQANGEKDKPEEPTPMEDAEADTAPVEKLQHITPGPAKLAKFPSTPFHTPNDGSGAQTTTDPVSTGSKLQKASSAKVSTPIQALNPYNNQFTIKAKIVQKYPKRSITTRSGESKSLFTIELVDEQGTAIEATLWGELADKHYDLLESGKVYYFTKGRVKPANKQYSSVKNDYAIDFSNGTDIEECDEQNMPVAEAKLEIVPIDQLAAHIGKKVMIDVMGIVTHVAPLGSVKRKTDAAELIRRDITLVDTSCKSVNVTLWGDTAEKAGAQLEEMDCPVVAIASVRVTDFNGVSVSTVTRSRVVVQPKNEQAEQLKCWYKEVGQQKTFTPAGEGLMSAARWEGSGTTINNGLATLADVVKPGSVTTEPDAKAEYFTVHMTVSKVEPDQTMYYMACPEDNKKVIEKDGGYWCEYEGKLHDSMCRRYVMRATAADFSKDTTVNIFDAEGQVLLGCTADALHDLREGSENNTYATTLRRAQWTQWTARLQVKTREYNGEARRQVSVQSMTPLEYGAESGKLVNMIAKLVGAQSA